MKNFLYVLTSVSFIGGLWWGFYMLGNSHRSLPTLTVLTYKNIFSPKVLRRVESSLNAKIEIDVVENASEWMDRFQQNSGFYDIVTPYHFQAGQLSNKKHLRPLNKNLLNRLSVDFRPKPSDGEGFFHIPYYWGALGFLHRSNFAESEALNETSNLATKEDLVKQVIDNIFEITPRSRVAVQKSDLSIASKLGFLLDALGGSLDTEKLTAEKKIRPSAKNPNGLQRKKQNDSISSRPFQIVVIDHFSEQVSSDKKTIFQMSHGQASRFIRKNEWAYSFPKEIELWSLSLAISAKTSKPKLAMKFIEAHLEAAHHVASATDTRKAMTSNIHSLALAKKLHPMQDASFLRKLPMERTLWVRPSIEQ